MHINHTAIGFLINAIVSFLLLYIVYQGYKRDKDNKIGESFFVIFLALFLYFIFGATGSLFFTFNPLALNVIRIIKEILQGVFTGYVLRFSVLLFYREYIASNALYVFFILWFSRIIADIALIGNPGLRDGFIYWDAHYSIIGLQAVLQAIVLLVASFLLAKKAKEKWDDIFFRMRTMFISSGVIFSVIVVVLPLIYSARLLTAYGHAFSLLLILAGFLVSAKQV